VLDEPTSALDPTAQPKSSICCSIRAERDTAYLLSHDLSCVSSTIASPLYLGMIVEQGDAQEVFNRPHHPYASGLLSSVLLPHPHLKIESSVSLKGEIPSPINLPKGCFLASRCPFVIDRCRTQMPPMSIVDDGHFVHCFRHDVAASVPPSDTFVSFMREAERVLSRRTSTDPSTQVHSH
jgi:oligopeptide/dipeptide ABC transporter ATP-binding protein